jgi:Ca2+-binding RTX toxin-like protein
VVTEAAGEGTDTVQTTLATYTLGTNLENLTYTGTGNFAGTGNAEANVITGGAGNDTLDGAGGVDTLVGGAGNDTYILDNPGDVVTEGASAGTDTVQTALAAYTLGANLENLTYTGTGNFAGTGNAEANVITGGAGNDTLDGAAGADTLIGGAGNDIYFVDDAGDTLTEAAAGGTDTVETTLATYTLGAELENLSYVGTGNFTGNGNGLANVITGAAGADTLNGLAGADTLIGGGGADSLDGGVGADSMIGGAGDDTYIVDDAGDVIEELSDGGEDNVRTDLASYTLGANLENLTYTGTGNFTGTGNGEANEIVGGNGADTLNGMAGADNIYGGDGADSIDGGTGADFMSGDAGDDTYVVDDAGDAIQELSNGGEDYVQTSLASYTLGANLENLVYTGSGNFTGTGNAENNEITGGTGNGTLNGMDGADDIYGGAGNDSIDGGTGADFMSGDAGDDTYVVNNAGDAIQELSSGGKDTVITSLSTYTLGANLENLTYSGPLTVFSGTGNAEDNVIIGVVGNNVLRGESGDDTLTGGANSDVLVGGSGTDVLTGDAGDDFFVFNSLVGTDVVEDFVAGDDILQIDMSDIAIGNGDTTIDLGVTISGSMEWNGDNELVIATDALTSISAADVAAYMTASLDAASAGDTLLFVVNNGSDSAIYRYTSTGGSTVSTSELEEIAYIVGTDALALGDFAFIA